MSPRLRAPAGWQAVAVVTAGMACAACSSGSSGPASFPAEPFVSAISDSGELRVEVRTSPQPPARGTIDAQLVITRGTDRVPIDGLTVDIQPWMPAMNHGAIAPTVTARGDGVYLVTELDLFMPGHWELRTSLSGGPMADHVTPDVQIQ